MRWFPSGRPGDFFYRNLAAAKAGNFYKLVRNVMEHLF